MFDKGDKIWREGCNLFSCEASRIDDSFAGGVRLDHNGLNSGRFESLGFLVMRELEDEHDL